MNIALKHKISLKKLQKEFEIGMQVESEHTNDKEKQKEIQKENLKG